MSVKMLGQPSQEYSQEPSLDPVELFANIPEVLEKIFFPLSLPELQKCAQVSRSWRKKIKASFPIRNSTAYIANNCKEIFKLSSFVRPLEYCLINSVKIRLPSGHSKSCNFTPTTKQAETVRESSVTLRIRNLDIHAGACRVADSLLRQMLVGASDTLEELTLTYCDDAVAGNITYGMRKSFKKLKVINIGTRHGWSPDDAFNLARLAPRIQTLDGLFQLDEFEAYKFHRLELLTGLYITPGKNPMALKPVLQSQPKLTELLLCDIGSRTIPQSWIPDLCQLLRVWSCTLKKLSVCAFTLLELKYNMFSLETLDFLELFLPEDTSHVQFINIMARLSLHSLCPALTSIRIMFDHDFCSHELPRSLTVDAPDCLPSLSVREVTTEKAFCMPAVIGICVSLFPNLFSFAFESLQCTEICESTEAGHMYEVHRIWTEAPTLKQLKICVVDFDVSPCNYSLDALFCGISTTEARKIKQTHRKGGLDLQSFQFCPLRPSLSHAQKLEEVTVILSARYTYRRFCISEVAGILLFGRNPQLRLVIESHCPDASEDLAIMAPYGKITETSALDDWC